MKRYRTIRPVSTSLTSTESYEGETIEQKISRIMENKEPIKDGAPEIFTEKKDGVVAAYNIRTDRWEIAAEAMDKVTASYQAKSEEKARLAEEAEKGKVIDMNNQNQSKEIGGAEPIQGTD